MFVKVLLIIFDIVWIIWTIWGLGIHYNRIEGEQAYETPFPLARSLIMLVLIGLTIHVF